VVTLGNDLDALRTLVETNSLTAKVKKRLHQSQQSIDEINRAIDSFHCRIAEVTVRAQQVRDRIMDLDAR
jgi:SMC interacting uncharacterized protein involved in chromosome segregation